MNILLGYLPNYKLGICHIQEYMLFTNYKDGGYSFGISTKLQTEYFTYTRIDNIHKV